MRFDFLRCVLCLSVLVASTGQAATYYVRAGGNDSGDGLSPNTAWATLSRLKKQTFKTSDRVLLRDGDTFAGPVTIGWAGTATAPAVFGAYYVDSSGAAKQGFTSKKPTIQGGTPTGHYDAIVKIRASYVRVENIKTINPVGRGIDVTDATSPAIVGCTTDTTYGSGIHVQRSPTALVQNNYVSHAGLGSPQDGAPWGGAIEIANAKGAAVRNNFVVEVYGEGINTNGGSDGTVIENNSVYAARAVGIYSDAAPNTTIRRNIVTGTTNSTYWRSGKSVGAGIALNNEAYHYTGTSALAKTIQTQGARVYDNLVTYASTGIALWGELPESAFTGVLIFNNTLVDNDTQVYMQSNRPKTGGKFVNNILLSLSSGTRDVSGTDLGGMTAKNNYFSKGNPGGGYVNSGNRFSGLVLTRMTGWRSISAVSQVSWRDFTVKVGSTVIGAGDGEPEQMTQGNDTFAKDYNQADHNAPMDMGAVKFSLDPIDKPSKPGNLVLNN